MVRSRISLLFIVALIVLGRHNALGVQAAAQLQPAVIALDVDMVRIGQAGLDELMKQIPDSGPDPSASIMFKGTSRITAAFALPTSVEDFVTMDQDKPMPMDMYVRLVFRDAVEASKLTDLMLEEFEASDVDGPNWYKSRTGEVPNFRMNIIDSTTIELGTVNYLKRGDRKVYSPGLDKIWSAMPNHAFKLAVDLSGSKELIQGASDMLADQAPPEAKPFVDLLEKIASLKISADNKDATLLAIAVQGRDEAAAGELFSTIDGFLNMAKFTAGTQLERMKKETPQLADVTSALLASLKAVRNGTAVTIDLPRPAGLDAAISEGINRAKGAAAEMRDMNRLRQAALSVHNYFDVYNSFPFDPPQAANESKDLSWRVRVLPYLEENNLYEQIQRDESWDSAANRPFHEKMPAILGNNSKSQSDICAIKTAEPPTGFADITDGTSNTIMLVHFPKGVSWMKPQDLNVDDAVKFFESLKDGETLLVCFYDGSIRKLDSSTSADDFRAMLEPGDGR